MWLYVLCSVVVYLVAKSVYMRWRYDLHKVPSPPSVPVFGHLLSFKQLMKSTPISTIFRTWREQLGRCPVMKIQLLNKAYVYVMDADCARTIIAPKSNGMPRSPEMVNEWWRVFSGDSNVRSFFTTPTVTPYVKAMRRAMARVMTTPALKHHLPKFHRLWSSMQSVVDKSRMNGAINIEDLFVRATLDATGWIFYDYDFGDLEKEANYRTIILEALLGMKKVGSQPMMSFKMKYLPFMQDAKEMQMKFDRVIHLWRSIAADIRKRSDPGDPDTSLWAALKQFKDPGTNEPLSIQKLGAEIGTAIVAGMDTTSHTMAWTLALLGSHPAALEAAVDELKMLGLLGPDSSEIEFDQLSQLEYLTAILKEAMRLIHVPVALRRVLDRDMALCGYRMPKGTMINVAGTNMVNSEEDWDAPLEFRPERWLCGDDMSKKYYFPFSYGERDCIGQRYAMVLMQFIMSNFIKHYAFELVNGETFQSLFNDQVLSVVVESRNGIHLKITKRD